MRHASPEQEQLSFSDISDLSFSFLLDPSTKKRLLFAKPSVNTFSDADVLSG
jgi:hypothetical protein